MLRKYVWKSDRRKSFCPFLLVSLQKATRVRHLFKRQFDENALRVFYSFGTYDLNDTYYCHGYNLQFQRSGSNIGFLQAVNRYSNKNLCVYFSRYCVEHISNKLNHFLTFIFFFLYKSIVMKMKKSIK